MLLRALITDLANQYGQARSYQNITIAFLNLRNPCLPTYRSSFSFINITVYRYGKGDDAAWVVTTHTRNRSLHHIRDTAGSIHIVVSYCDGQAAIIVSDRISGGSATALRHFRRKVECSDRRRRR